MSRDHWDISNLIARYAELLNRILSLGLQRAGKEVTYVERPSLRPHRRTAMVAEMGAARE